jgi:hypothetical protein
MAHLTIERIELDALFVIDETGALKETGHKWDVQFDGASAWKSGRGHDGGNCAMAGGAMRLGRGSCNLQPAFNR